MKFSNVKMLVSNYKKGFEFDTGKRLFKTILILLIIFPITVKSQQTSQPDSLLNKLTGKWILEGRIEGKETIHDIDAERVLNGQYVQIKEVSREKDEKGNPLYEAVVYLCWQESKQQYFCLWLDNTSNEGITNGVIGSAKQNGDNIELLFKYSNILLIIRPNSKRVLI